MPAPTGARSGGRGGRGPRRPPPRQVEVLAVEPITPRLLSVTVGGPDLEGFGPPRPTAHIKLFLPDESGHLPSPVVAADGMVDWPDGRPQMRTYTPRRFDADARTLEIQFVLHGDGVAARWAESARPGDRVAIGGPGGGLDPDPSVSRWLLAADLSALPAAATLLEALPADAEVDLHVELDDADQQAPLPDHPGLSVTWHHLGAAEGSAGGSAAAAVPGSALEAALAAATVEPGTHVWVACEAAAVRRIRRALLEAGHPAAALTTRGYWRAGAANHPDHDFGED